MEKFNIPTNRELKLAILHLQKKYPANSFSGNHIDIFKECINSLGGDFYGAVQLFHPKQRKIFVRIRNGDSFQTEEQVNDPTQYSYVPKGWCESMGRAHIPFNPVFYASDKISTSLLEMKKPNLKKYYVAFFLTDEILFESYRFVANKRTGSSRLSNEIQGLIQHVKDEHPNYSNTEKEDILNLIYAWGDIFTSDNYSLSSSIAHGVLNYANGKYDSISYNSVQDLYGINYAVHPRLANKLTLHKVMETILIGNKPKIKRVGELNKSEKLTWRGPNLSDKPGYDPLLPIKFDYLW